MSARGASAPAFLSVAEDVNGPAKVRPFAERFDFPTVVDEQAMFMRLMDSDAVPNGLLLNAEGRVVFRLVGGFDIRRPEVRAQMDGLMDELAQVIPTGSTPPLPQRSVDAETMLIELAAAPDDPDLWTTLAEIHARDGGTTDALDAYDRSLALAPDSSPAHFGRGTTLAHLGRPADAEAAWVRALQLDPASFIVRKQIWAHRNPEKFWPDIDFAWQKAEMAREQAGESDLPPRPM